MKLPCKYHIKKKNKAHKTYTEPQKHACKHTIHMVIARKFKKKIRNAEHEHGCRCINPPLHIRAWKEIDKNLSTEALFPFMHNEVMG